MSLEVVIWYLMYSGYFFAVMLSVNAVDPWKSSTSKTAPTPVRLHHPRQSAGAAPPDSAATEKT